MIDAQAEDLLALACLALLGLPVLFVVWRLPAPWRMSRATLVAWLLSLVLPAALMVIADRSPAEVEGAGGDGLAVIFMDLAVGSFLVVVSAVEIVTAIVARRPTLFLDGGSRLLLLATGHLVAVSTSDQVEIGWNALRSMLPAYACHATRCDDAIVSDLRFGGAFGTPRCGSQLIRLGDPKGGRAAVVRVLHPTPFGTDGDAEKFADMANVTALGRGFYHAITCDEN